MAQPSDRRRAWPFYLAVGLVLAALPVGYFVLLGSEAPPPPPPPVVVKPPEAEKRPHELKLSEIKGQVQVRRGDGQWVPATQGEALKSSDAVRTSDGAYAVLVGGEAYEVKMEPGTEVAVSELSDSISKLLLESGMATARVKGGARHTFEVRASGTDAVARTESGTFAISSNGAGTVAVGTHEGEVEFLGGGKVVIVRAGQQSVVRPGQAGPSEPTAIPTSLLLKVSLPVTSTVNRRKLILAGQAEPGSHIEVAGRVVSVDAKGKFSMPVELAEGQNRLEVSAKSVGGLSATSHHGVLLDTRVNKLSIDKHLWENPGGAP
ncbi:MAG: FecR family protein [Myxococcaceae bacterium]